MQAAAEAFNTEGFHSTDTNKIARAAGFAPQTFYRHFRDKMEVFLAVYERWQKEERNAIRQVSQERGAERAITKVVLEHHVQWKVFRQSLRWLAIEDARARAARTGSRERQIDDLVTLAGNVGRSRAELLTALLAAERMFDAAADGELADAGLDASTIEQILREAVRGCRARTRRSGTTGQRADE